MPRSSPVPGPGIFRGRAFYQMWLETRNTGATSLVLEPPDGFETVLAARDGSRLTPGLEGRSLVLPLTVSRQGQVLFLSVFAPMRLPPGDGFFESPLPSLSVPVREVYPARLRPDRPPSLPLAPVMEELVVSAEAPTPRSVEEMRRERQNRQISRQELQRLQQGMVGGVKPLPVEIPETGKLLVLSGALPPPEVSVTLRVKGR